MKILFLLAHPDDEAYGPGGTIAKLSKDNEVIIALLCNGARPGSVHVTKHRQKAFNKSCELLGAAEWYIGTYDDCTLQLNACISECERIISAVNPDIVYTHNTTDLHNDHRTLAEAVLVAARPKPGSNVKELYMCENVGTNWGFGTIGNGFSPDTFIDVSDTINKKEDALLLYSTEVYEYPDARSIVSTRTLAMHRGSSVGVSAAEAFKQVFRLA